MLGSLSMSKTIFLAAGRSSRMKPLSDKNFLDFCGEPLILRLLKNAQKGGLKNFVIVGNEDNKDKIKEICSHNEFLQNAVVTIQTNLDEGMAGGITEGLKFIEDDEGVTILGGNDYVNHEIYREIIEQSKDLNGGILAKKVTEYFPGGYLSLNKEENITGIVEKPGEGNEPSDVVNIIVHHFNQSKDLKSALNQAQSSEDDVYEVALDALFKSGKYKAVEYDDYWQAIKYPWHVLQLMDLLLHQDPKELLGDRISEFEEVAPSIWIHKTVGGKTIFSGSNIILDEKVRPYHNVCISGPAYIGPYTTLGNNCLVRNSIIGKNCCVGYNTEIARSYLANGVTSHIAYIGDSVVDSEVNFGAYSCAANLRLDKQTVQVKIKDQRIDSKMEKLGAIVGAGAQIGIHAALMPGAKVEVDEFIPPHSMKK